MAYKYSEKGQVSIELIIILGMLIIGAIIFAVFYINASNKNVGSASEIIDSQEDIVDDYIDDLEGYLKGFSKDLYFPNSFSKTISF